MKSLGKGFDIQRRGSVIAVYECDAQGAAVKELMEFPVSQEAIDLLVNPYSPQFMEIQGKISNLKTQVDKLTNESYKQQDVDDMDCKLAALVKTVDAMNTELHQMPGGFRNSQDIKRLQKKVDDLVAEGGPVTEAALLNLMRDVSIANGVASTAQRISDKNYSDIENLRQHHMELSGRFSKLETCGTVQWLQGTDKKIGELQEIARVMSQAFDDLKKDHSHHYTVHGDAMKSVECRLREEMRADIRSLQDSNEQRKKDIKHAWNICDELKKENAILKVNFNSANGALNTHMAKCAQFSQCGDPTKKMEQLEECCKNTVAAGKEVEKKVAFVEAKLVNQSARLDAHKDNLDGLTKAAARSQKFMEKLHASFT
jgi:hypothetical protein